MYCSYSAPLHAPLSCWPTMIATLTAASAVPTPTKAARRPLDGRASTGLAGRGSMSLAPCNRTEWLSGGISGGKPHRTGRQGAQRSGRRHDDLLSATNLCLFNIRRPFTYRSDLRGTGCVERVIRSVRPGRRRGRGVAGPAAGPDHRADQRTWRVSRFAEVGIEPTSYRKWKPRRRCMSPPPCAGDSLRRARTRVAGTDVAGPLHPAPRGGVMRRTGPASTSAGCLTASESTQAAGYSDQAKIIFSLSLVSVGPRADAFAQVRERARNALTCGNALYWSSPDRL